MKLCGFDVGLDQPFFLIAGPCVIESQQMALDTAGELKAITAELGASCSVLHLVERRLGQQVKPRFGLCLLDADPALLVAC